MNRKTINKKMCIIPSGQGIITTVIKHTIAIKPGVTTQFTAKTLK